MRPLLTNISPKVYDKPRRLLGKESCAMRKWKIRFVLPVCLCCLLVCGLAVGSRYAWGVTLMQIGRAHV